MKFGFFTSNWETGHTAKDGAVLGFEDVATTIIGWAATRGDVEAVPLRFELFLDRNALAAKLAELDAVYANCGPLAALVLSLREQNDYPLRIFREARTLGWVGYAFQEFIALELARDNDVCLHPSRFSRDIWNSIRPGDDRFYYPQLKQTPQRTVALGASPRSRATMRSERLGYFSRISSDKGCQFVPQIVARALDANQIVRTVDFCGVMEAEDLFEQVCRELRELGVEPQYHGELDREQTHALMHEVDTVLFPSTSSFEASGRVVLEAWHAGKAIITSDFCAGADVVAPELRIPLESSERDGSTVTAFPIADLRLSDWSFPAIERHHQVFNDALCCEYVAEPSRLDAIIGEPTENPRQAGLRMQLDWSVPTFAASDWGEQLWDRLRLETRNSADLVDLGGSFKRSIIDLGFHPKISFRC